MATVPIIVANCVLNLISDYQKLLLISTAIVPSQIRQIVTVSHVDHRSVDMTKGSIASIVFVVLFCESYYHLSSPCINIFHPCFLYKNNSLLASKEARNRRIFWHLRSMYRLNGSKSLKIDHFTPTTCS